MHRLGTACRLFPLQQQRRRCEFGKAAQHPERGCQVLIAPHSAAAVVLGHLVNARACQCVCVYEINARTYAQSS